MKQTIQQAIQALTHMTEQHLQNATDETLYELLQQALQTNCQQLWAQGEEATAYDLYVAHAQWMAPTIERANMTIAQAPKTVIPFLDDMYALEDIDPIELCIFYSDEAMQQLTLLEEEPPFDNYELPMDIVTRIYELINQYGIIKITEPFVFNFVRQEFEELVYDYSLAQQQQLLAAMFKRTKHPVTQRDEQLLGTYFEGVELVSRNAVEEEKQQLIKQLAHFKQYLPEERQLDFLKTVQQIDQLLAK